MHRDREFLYIGFMGLAVAAMSLVMLAVFPAKAPGLPENFFTPIITFEFIQTPDEVYLLFGEKGSAGRETMVHAMDLGNRLDVVYMVLYSGFLMAFCIKAARLGMSAIPDGWIDNLVRGDEMLRCLEQVG